MASAITLNADTLLNSAKLPRMPCDKSHVLVACFPKSGSTWLSETLSRLPGYRRVDLVPDYDHREQELAFERLIIFHPFDYVTQHHCRFSRATERYMEIFSIKPIILVRNIFDCVVSIKEFWDQGKNDDERLVGSIACVPTEYHRWPEEEKFDFIIDMVIPWYFNFFVGWRSFAGGNWVTYEDLVAQPLVTIKNVSDKLGLGLGHAVIEAALGEAERQPTRFNVGKAGRGEMLKRAQKEKIRTFAAYYGTQDFSAIGL